MVSNEEAKVLVQVDAIASRFSERIAKLPKGLRKVFFSDLETAVENRLAVLERTKE